MDVQDYFRQYQQPWKAGFEKRLQTLPAELSTGIRERLKDARDWQENEAKQKAFAQMLRQLDDQTLEAVCGVFFPQFPALVARTYQNHLKNQPYTSGYTRRAFRSAEHPAHAETAANWLWSLWNLTRDYPQEIEWFAVSAGLMNPWQSQSVGLLLAQAISDGDETVFQVIKDTASTQHPVARMGRHVPLALLASQSAEAHTLAEGLLLAAQRQEGLRQVILESVDEASLDAFVRMLRLIMQEDMLRFAATLRAACVWFGLNYEVTDLKTVKKLVGQGLNYLEDSKQAHAAVQSGSGVDAYLALFTLGMHDAMQTADLARTLLKDADAERRMAAVQFLQAADLLDDQTQSALIADPDVRIGALAAQTVNRWGQNKTSITFEQLADYAGRLSADSTQRPLLFPWLGQTPSRSDVLDNLPELLDTRPFTALSPYLAGMSSGGKSSVLEKLEKHSEKHRLDAPTRELLLTLLQDRNSGVSQEAVKVMANFAPNPAEVEVVHTLLKRKSADLRRGLIRLLAKDKVQGEQSALELLSVSNTEQRQAGLQLLAEVGGTPPETFKPKNLNEETLLAKLTNSESALTLKDGLGLFDPASLTQATELLVRERDYPADVARGAQLLKSLDDLIEANKETPLTGVGYDGPQTHLLMNISPWWLRWDDTTDIPLKDLWETWWNGRPEAQDGDVTRLRWAINHFVNRADTNEAELAEELADDDFEFDHEADRLEAEQEKEQEKKDAIERQHLIRLTLHRTLGPLVTLRLAHTNLLQRLGEYFSEKFYTDTDTAMSLDAWETALSRLPKTARVLGDPQYTWHQTDPRDLLSLKPVLDLETISPAHFRQFWNIQLYENTSFPNLSQRLMGTAHLLKAYELGLASRPDLLRQLIGERPQNEGYSIYGNRFDDLQDYTRRRLREDVPTHPDWLQAVSDVRDRVLEVELSRGDLETPATLPAQALQSVNGAALVLRLLVGMGQNPLKRGYSYNNTSKDATFSHLLRVSFPLPENTVDTFKAQVKAFGLKDTRLLDLAMFAPQWAGTVSSALGWSGLHDGVYWLHAHTKDSNWSVPQEVRDAWEGEISERTPLKASDLTEGAVDVAWFRQMYSKLGKERFQTLLSAAKYASSSGGHKRAELFASAILGEIPEAELLTRIQEKRNQDAVRSLGLLPLGKGKKGQKDVEGRYRTLSDFWREAKQFGAQRQASERLAADIGMQNLARTAGYADPQRLMWAMEARMAPDWQQVVTVDGVTVHAEMNGAGEATLHVARGEKPLKNLPPALKKNPQVAALREAVKELDATRSRMRTALEEAMIRGDYFSGQELTDLSQHPVIAPMLQNLVWVLNEKHIGFWRGNTLKTLTGTEKIGDFALRLAHPHDLFTDGHWREYQAHLIEHQLAQPFKQVFREYYPLTPAEKGAKRSTRYEGHHVQPAKAAALLKARGWVSVYEEGTRKTYHAEGINVWIDDTLGYGTPNEVEGMPLHAAYFIRRDEWQPMPLAEVPPRLFSETMRDLDLVVSVAHTGGVDPEASQSTVEMRESLLRETLRLLKIKNVRLENQHALIEGEYSKYSVHLGSGTVHRQPGGFMCIIPVHNQQQGRIFLPFSDPDPRTAEVVSKVLLLAEDKKIQDPTILEQLR